ncbi:MAG: glucans biosynthesis glucosyltransferase MdoH [Gammaproteobacteria bacterium]
MSTTLSAQARCGQSTRRRLLLPGQWLSSLANTTWWRRPLFLTLIGLSVIAGGSYMLDILRANGFSTTELVMLALFVVSFLWISFSFWTGFMGFLIRVLAVDPVSYVAPIVKRATPTLDPDTRIAVVMPIHNEDVDRVFAGLVATFKSVMASGYERNFEFFMLSDTTDEEILHAEQRLLRCDEVRKVFAGRLQYERRDNNEGGKAGNIAAFCARHGSRFRYMAVLDADSVMSGETLVRLARVMDGNPAAGIVQTVPRLTNQATPFARLVQFGSRTCSEMFSLGQSFWQQGHGVYYGHNAMLRLQPFMAYCDLPTLPGRGPLSGKIMSHDFVESALMCRAGHEVWNLPESRGSYEEMPNNIIDFAARDRRWCQGNLQHLRLLGMPGLRLTGRLQLLMGALAYLSSAVWLLLLTLGVLLVALDVLNTPLYFGPEESIYPIWPIVKAEQSISLFTLTIAMLLLPKVLAVGLVLLRTHERKAYGGARAVVMSASVEILLAAMLAPVMMLHHTSLVAAILTGRAVRWNAQPRDSRSLSFREALERHGTHVLVGVVLAGCVVMLSPKLIWWFSPVVFGLLLSVPLAMVSSRADLGLFLRRFGLFLTPEETTPPAELAHLDAGDRAAA